MSVGSLRATRDFDAAVDDVISFETPEWFRSVGPLYEQFDQVSDQKTMVYLDNA